jgi:HD-like signal output (HDOD) protein
VRRILIVDDEPRVLDGLRRMLFPKRREWETEYAESGDAALQRCAEAAYDVVITDMRMPGMDGATLLTRVKELHPDTVRIVFSGQSSPEAALRAVPVAHQFLNKPCDAVSVVEVITRACNLRDMLTGENLRRMVGRLDSLPTVPRVYSAIRQRLATSEWSIGDVVAVIEQDPAMVAKLLQLSNSGFFGLPRQVSSLGDAIIYLGAGVIEKLVLSIEVMRQFSGCGSLDAADLEQEHRHAHLVARIARALHTDRFLADASFTAALLHDIGVLVLVANTPDAYAEVLATARGQRRPLHEVERQIQGVTHAEVGAYLLGIWGLPYPIVEAVAHHHDPSAAGPSKMDVMCAVYIADCLANEVMSPCDGTLDAHHEGICEGLLASMGVADRLGDWRKLAAELAAVPEGAI